MQKLAALKNIVKELEDSQRRANATAMHSTNTDTLCANSQHNKIVCQILNELYQELSELESSLPDADVEIDFGNYSKIKVRISAAQNANVKEKFG